jgi:hypothetical protein
VKERIKICIETGIIYYSVSEAARQIGLSSHTHIAQVCRGKRPHAGGYHWEYI